MSYEFLTNQGFIFEIFRAREAVKCERVCSYMYTKDLVRAIKISFILISLNYDGEHFLSCIDTSGTGQFLPRSLHLFI